MAQAMYAAFTIHRAVGGADATTAETVLYWATAGGARALGLEGTGTLEVGKAADLLLLDLNHPRYFGQHDPAIGPIISGGELSVRFSFVAGREIVVNGQLPWLDLRALRADAARIVARLQSGAT